jgi:MFS transporter, OFA family, oxalate/formate antiporter
MSANSSDSVSVLGFGTGIYYGWIIVGVCSLTMAIAYGLMYSFSVFFKPIVAQFNWDRATVSSIYSLSLIFRGAVSMGIGWLADRYGPMKLSAFCGVMIGLGLVLASRVTALWQFYVAYGLIVAVGLSGAYTIGSAVTARWFDRRRGMALGLVAAGSGLGTMTLVPLAEFLIATYNWSTAMAILGIGGGCFITATAFLLRSGPHRQANATPSSITPDLGCKLDMPLKKAAFSREMTILVTIFLLVNFCLQMVMIHLVNYATDMGISSLRAAGFVGVIGVVSVAGRLLMGGASDKIGTYNSLVICSILFLVSLVVLLLNRSLLGFYVFVVIFGFAYGGEIPQLPMFIGQIFGVRTMAALMGYLVFIGTLGGALGPWVGGKIYDATQNYRIAFGVAAAAGVIRLVLVLKSKKYLCPVGTALTQ